MATANRPSSENTNSTHGREYRPGNGHDDLSPESESVPGLLRRFSNDLTSLLTSEISLARAEMREATSQVTGALISMASGGIVLMGGFLVLLSAAVAGLALVVELWLSALIVGGVVTLIGLMMVMGGKKKLQPSELKPDRTEESIRKDSDMIKRKTS